jgi:hypothetical protein
MMPDVAPIPVMVRGNWRGVAVEEPGTVAIVGEVIALTLGGWSIELPPARLEGAAWRTSILTIFGAIGETLALEGDASLARIARALHEIVFAFPELTRTLQAFGSHRANPGTEHDQFFDGLMRARRFAEESAELEPRLAAFNAARLTEGFSRTFAEFAAVRFPSSAPDRRAIEAELVDLAERLYSALRSMDDSALRLRAADERTRYGRWREWTVAARRVFEEADRWWMDALPVLAGVRPRKGRRKVARRESQ